MEIIFVLQQNYLEAKKCYLSGISLYIDSIDEQEPKVRNLLVQFFNNLALCDLKLKNYNSAMDSCSTVLSWSEIDEQAKSKAHYRFGCAIDELRSDCLKTPRRDGKIHDKDWCTKEARYHFQQSDFYSKGSDNNTKKKIQTLNKIISTPKGFEGMFDRQNNNNRGLPKF